MKVAAEKGQTVEVQMSELDKFKEENKRLKRTLLERFE